MHENVEHRSLGEQTELVPLALQQSSIDTQLNLKSQILASQRRIRILLLYIFFFKESRQLSLNVVAFSHGPSKVHNMAMSKSLLVAFSFVSCDQFGVSKEL